MEKQPLLFLAIANRAYSGHSEMIDLLSKILQHEKLDVCIEIVPEKEIVETAKRRKPALILAGYRRTLDSDPSMPPYGGDALKALKSDPETRNIPILMLEGITNIEWMLEADGCRVDACVTVPFGPPEFLDAVARLTGMQTGV